jgi:alpha-galactosidase
MMGCHIGPPTAHTTGRTHTLDFRAGTAMFGHLGIEWNVASEEVSISDDISALHNCVSLYKDYRALLHSGDVVRSDLPVPGCLLHGVVARDRSEALYAYASTDSVHENPVGLLRLPGLDPDRTYRVSPVGPRSLWETGMRARPAWWRGGVGVTETGKALANHGVQAPALHPEEVALIHVRATDAD